MSEKPDWAEIGKVDEAARVAEANRLGLPETTSWADMYAFMDEQERATITAALGLPTYPEAKAHGLSPYPSWRNILTGVLDLPTGTSVTEIVQRVGEIKGAGEE